MLFKRKLRFIIVSTNFVNNFAPFGKLSVMCCTKQLESPFILKKSYI